MSANPPIGVLVVSTSEVLLDRIAALLAEHSDVGLVGKASSVDDALRRASGGGFDLVLVDLNGASAGSLRALAELRAAAQGSQLVALALDPTPELRAHCSAIGVATVHAKSELTGALVESLAARVRRSTGARC